MARELKNANITHISYVDKGANQKRFFFTKSTQKPDFEKQVRLITKADDPKQLVYGVVYEPDAEDTHGDIMTADEIEKAVHGFMSNLAIAKGAVMDTQHDFDPGVGDVVECYVAPVDFEMGEETIKKGSWVLVTKANDEIWNKIQDGEVTGYSMAGTAETIEKKKEPAAKSNDEVTGFFNLMKSFFTGEKIAKAGKKISNGNMKHIDDAIAALTELKTKTAPAEEAEPKEDDDLNAEDIAKAVQAAMAPIAKQVEDLTAEITELKKQEGEGSEPVAGTTGTEGGAAAQPDALTDAITKAIAPLQEQMQTLAADVQIVKNSRGGSTQGPEGDPITKSAVPSYIRAMNGGQ